MGNITGAMVFQSCLPTVLGLLFTTWLFTPETAISLRVGRCRLRLTLADLRDDAAARAPVGMDIADRWSAVPDLRLPGPVHAPRAGLAMGTNPRIPQPSKRASRHGKGRAYTCPAGSAGDERRAEHFEETFVLKQGTPTATTADDRTAELWAFFRGEIVPLRDARISVMTHAFNYGTAVFEGIRAYWNAEQGQLWALDLIPHYERLKASARLPDDGGAVHRRAARQPRRWRSSAATGCARTSTSARSSTSRARRSASGCTTWTPMS